MEYPEIPNEGHTPQAGLTYIQVRELREAQAGEHGVRWLCQCTKCGPIRNTPQCMNPGRDRYDNDNIFCTRACDECWLHSGYAVATDPSFRNDPTYAGERIDDDY